jgi:hypothetical protein
MKIRRTLSRNILLAGFYGGMAEVVWVASYCLLTGQSGAEVARQVTASMAPGLAAGAQGVLMGIAVHFALSLLVAAAYVQLAWRPFAHRLNEAQGIVVACAALALVWAVNFLVVLPALHPVFVGLLPYPVTFVSKLLFGVAMAGSLQDGLKHSVAGACHRAARAA